MSRIKSHVSFPFHIISYFWYQNLMKKNVLPLSWNELNTHLKDTLKAIEQIIFNWNTATFKNEVHKLFKIDLIKYYLKCYSKVN